MLQLLFDVATPCIDITYAAHTASCTFLLDAEGICRRIVMAPKGKRRDASRSASRCVGAQYVASLDSGAAGGLVEMPRVGAAMLFARVDERGRVSLVRTGVVTSFESKAGEDPFVDSGTVETSAPDLLTPRVGEDRDARLPDPDYYDPSERTQRIQALRPEDVAAALGQPGEPTQGNDLTTAEYEVASEEPFQTYRKTLPSNQPVSSRGMLPRRSDPHMRAAATARAYVPPARASDVQISPRRRRGG